MPTESSNQKDIERAKKSILKFLDKSRIVKAKEKRELREKQKFINDFLLKSPEQQAELFWLITKKIEKLEDALQVLEGRNLRF